MLFEVASSFCLFTIHVFIKKLNICKCQFSSLGSISEFNRKVMTHWQNGSYCNILEALLRSEKSIPRNTWWCTECTNTPELSKVSYHVWAEGSLSVDRSSRWIWNFWVPFIPSRKAKPCRGTFDVPVTNCINLALSAWSKDRKARQNHWIWSTGKEVWTFNYIHKRQQLTLLKYSNNQPF